jgi:hypothetical protein
MCTQKTGKDTILMKIWFIIERGAVFFIRFDGCMNSDFVFGDMKMFTPTLRCAQWLILGK